MSDIEDMLAKYEKEIYKVAHSCAPDYSSRFTFDDLVEEGRAAAIKAFNKYDPNRGTKFHTYLRTSLKNELGKFIGKNAYDFYVSDNDQKKEWKKDKCRTLKDIRVINIDNVDSSIENTIPSGYISNPEEAVMFAESIHVLNEEIDNLDDIERDIIKGRYFENKNLETLAIDYGVSCQSIHNWEKRAFEKLSKKVRARLQ